MSDVQHSPTPWRACGANNGDCKCGLIWAPAIDRCVLSANSFECDVFDHGDAAPSVDMMNANVRFVVKAVNTHEELVAVVKRLLRVVDSINGYEMEYSDDTETACADARKLLGLIQSDAMEKQ